MRYECNPKHKLPWQRGRKGALCPRHVDQATAQQLLEGSEAAENNRYAVYEGRAYRAQQHAADAWHGYPVGWVEVPAKLRLKWLAEGRLRKKDLQEHWDE